MSLQIWYYYYLLILPKYSRLCFIRTHWSKQILSEFNGEMGLSQLFGCVLMVVLYSVLSSCACVKRMSGLSSD